VLRSAMAWLPPGLGSLGSGSAVGAQDSTNRLARVSGPTAAASGCSAGRPLRHCRRDESRVAFFCNKIN
jgi:hypothetical protein